MQSAIIDCRLEQDFLQGHHKMAANIPAVQLFRRMHELPDKSTAIDLFACKQSLETARYFLLKKGYRLQSQTLWGTNSKTQLQQQQTFAKGPASYFYWQPASITKQLAQLLPSDASILDIGAGNGRDSVFLARLGHRVSIIDYHQEAISRSLALAKSHHCSLTSYCFDVQKDPNLSQLDNPHFDAIIAIRFLHRPLLQHLASRLNPGGFIAWYTFLQGAEKISTPKDPQFLLQKDELKKQFSDFILLENSVNFLPDGRPMNYFLAQKAR